MAVPHTMSPIDRFRRDFNSEARELLPDCDIEIIPIGPLLTEYVDGIHKGHSGLQIRTEMKMGYQMIIQPPDVPHVASHTAYRIASAYLTALEEQAALLRQRMLLPNAIQCAKCELERRQKLGPFRLFYSRRPDEAFRTAEKD